MNELLPEELDGIVNKVLPSCCRGRHTCKALLEYANTYCHIIMEGAKLSTLAWHLQ